jgi:gamma-glutamyltranspeptidase/glutathione hydrolase
VADILYAGTKGVVSCTQPLATEVGLEILRKGGNAADAAVAVSAALGLTEVIITLTSFRLS